MKELLFFSHNQKKIIEINQLFKSSKIIIRNLNSFKKIKEPKETGKTFFENAKIKSKYGLEKFNIPCFADDSGFCVEALSGKPGIMSKRFFSNFSSKTKAFDYIISNAVKNKNYKAFFVTVISLSIQKSHHVLFVGKIKGRVSIKPKGSNGFGYDPIFIPENSNKTFAEMSARNKNKISHRMIAISKLKSFLI
mgnify:CR=1 FL=1